jgi:hypothetical protein
VENWKLSDKRRHIWRAGVGSFSTRQLYREGERNPQGALNGLPGRLRRTRTGYTTSSTAPQKWANPSSIEFVYTTVGYFQAICGVAKIQGTPREDNGDESPVRNSSSFLTKARTWAIDRSRPGRHYIYYRAAAGEDPNTLHFTAPEQQTLVKGSGTKGAPLHDVAFKGITFDNTTWLAPDKPRGFVQMFGDYYFDGGSPSGSLAEGTVKARFVPAGLTFEHGRNLLFEGDRFTHLGADAIDVTGSVGNVFRGNVFEDSAGGAVKLDGLNDGSDIRNLFEDNWIHGVGPDYQGSIALYLGRGAECFPDTCGSRTTTGTTTSSCSTARPTTSRSPTARCSRDAVRAAPANASPAVRASSTARVPNPRGGLGSGSSRAAARCPSRRRHRSARAGGRDRGVRD